MEGNPGTNIDELIRRLRFHQPPPSPYSSDPSTAATPAAAELFLSAQWYHGPACQGPSYLLKISLRTRLSKPGETPVPVGISTRDLDKGSHGKGSRQGLVEAPTSLSKVGSLQASSASLAERTWALRFPQSHGRAKAL